MRLFTKHCRNVFVAAFLMLLWASAVRGEAYYVVTPGAGSAVRYQVKVQP